VRYLSRGEQRSLQVFVEILVSNVGVSQAAFITDAKLAEVVRVQDYTSTQIGVSTGRFL
jgi:hypothetical protein